MKWQSALWIGIIGFIIYGALWSINLTAQGLYYYELHQAAARIPLVMQRRHFEKNTYVRSDAEIFKMLSLKNLLSSGHVFELNSDGLALRRTQVSH